MPPHDLGGRKDVTYNIFCQRCDGSTSVSSMTQCEPCEPDLRFIPRPLGLTGTSVAILDFAMHASYTFHVEAVNGVSSLGVAARPLVNVTVNTHHAGELQCFHPQLLCILLSVLLNGSVGQDLRLVPIRGLVDPRQLLLSVLIVG